MIGGFLVLTALVAAILLIRYCDFAEREIQNPEGVRTDSTPEVVESGIIEGIDRRPASSGKARLVLTDALTGVSIIPPETWLIVDDERLRINRSYEDVEVGSLVSRDNVRWLEYLASSLPSADSLRYRLEFALPEEGSTVPLVIPYQSRLEVFVQSATTGLPAPATVKAALVDPQTWERALDLEETPISKIYPRNSIQFRMALYESMFGAIEWLPCERAPDQSYRVTLPGSGLALMRITSPLTHPKIVEARTMAGAAYQERVSVIQRPVIRGSILRADGSPAKGAQVIIRVLMLNDAFDFYDSDRDLGIASLSNGDDNEMYTVVAVPTLTDAEGRFQVATPAGGELSITAWQQAEYCFVATHAHANSQAEEIPPIKMMRAPAADDPDVILIKLVDASSNPLRDMSVDYAIVDDDPWYRSFPTLVTDENGICMPSGVVPGGRLGFIIWKPSLPPMTCTLTVSAGVNTIMVE